MKKRRHPFAHSFLFLPGLGLAFAFAFPPAARAQINEFSNKFMTVRTYIEAPSYQIDIQSKVNPADQVTWQPNIRVLTGVDVSINDFIGAGIGWANDVGAQPGIVEGNTSYIDYRLGLTLRTFHAEANYQSYQGFYVSNTAQVNPAVAATGVDVQDPGMVGTNISVNTTFILSPDRFSYAAALGQNERQESSGGSFLLGLAAADTAFSSANGLIPGTIQSEFGGDQTITKAQFYGLNFKIGYGYTIAWTKKWFTSFIFNLGIGGEYRDYGDSLNETKAGGGTSKLDALLSFGYNGDTFLAAFIATGDDTTYTTNWLQIPAVLGDVKLAVGAHF